MYPKSGNRNPDEQNRKVFIGGLSYTTTDDTLKEFYSQWGEVIDCIVMRDPSTKRSRGFGFVTYSEATMLDEAMKNRPHSIDGKVVEPKRAVPREDSSKPENHMSVRKLYVSGVREEHTEEMFREHFSKYGMVEDVELITDKQTGQKRGFGFILFNDYDAVDKCVLQRSHIIGGKRCDVKKALSKEEMRKLEEQERERAARSGRSKDGYDQRSGPRDGGGYNNYGPPGQGGAPGGGWSGGPQGGWQQGPQGGWQQQQGGPQGGSWNQGNWQGGPQGGSWNQQGAWQPSPASAGYGGAYNYNAPQQGYQQGQGWSQPQTGWSQQGGQTGGWGQTPVQGTTQQQGGGGAGGAQSSAQNYGTGGYSYGTNFQSGGWRSQGQTGIPPQQQLPSTGSNSNVWPGQANGASSGNALPPPSQQGQAPQWNQQQQQQPQAGQWPVKQEQSPVAGQWSVKPEQQPWSSGGQPSIAAQPQQPTGVGGQPMTYGNANTGQQGYGYASRA